MTLLPAEELVRLSLLGGRGRFPHPLLQIWEALDAAEYLRACQLFHIAKFVRERLGQDVPPSVLQVCPLVAVHGDVPQ